MSNATIANIRPRRKTLYLPASNPRAVRKARGLDADVVILDLEDAVLPEAKPDAPKPPRSPRWPRAVSAPGRSWCGSTGSRTPWEAADLAALATAGPDAVLVPRVRSPSGGVASL